MNEDLSYLKAGVDVSASNAAKRKMVESIDTGDPRVLNRLGAFASLVEGRFSGYREPVLVLKTEEPGSKQKLAFQHGRVASIAYDLINHLVNDIIVMGAEPLYVQDCIICGKIESGVVETLVSSMADACREQGCVLVGGETSEQPGVIDAGVYILSASIVGVVEKSGVIDGSRIEEGDCVLAVASNGLHTNGYSLVRALLDRKPELSRTKVGDESFLDAIMRPHKCYYHDFRDLFGMEGLHGIAHITGSGAIEGNLSRILPPALDARIDRSRIRILPVFDVVREQGPVAEDEMLRTFNLGVGMTIVASRSSIDKMTEHLLERGVDCYPIGEVVKGSGNIRFANEIMWREHNP